MMVLNTMIPGPGVDPAGRKPMGGLTLNERLMLSLVRRHGSLPKAEIARLTGLSSQTASVTMRRLEEDQLLVRGEPQRGRVGQPSIPLALNPDGVFAIGLKVGRRSAELLLMNFVGTVRKVLREAYAWPSPEAIARFVAQGVPALTETLTLEQRERIAGLGVAVPFELWLWGDIVGADMSAWRDTDLVQTLAAVQPYPVFVENDATAACGAELTFGQGATYPDFIYFFVGYFIGGGVVLNGTVYRGRTGNAGAVGSMPVRSAGQKWGQLINVASLLMLEQALKAAGEDPSLLWKNPDDWDDYGAVLDAWIETTADNLAQAIAASCSVIDFSAAIIDGAFPVSVRARLVVATRAALGRLDLQGIIAPEVVEGTTGSMARAIGGASLPLFDSYLLDPKVMLKEAVW
jgi:predicted NBD/HSP70 family sugar kinase